MVGRLNTLLAAGLCLLVLVAAPARAVDEASVARLTSEVRRAVSGPPGQITDSVLVALRQLRDERLRPLFAEMASRDAVAARLQGIFGLADLSEDGKVNIVQIASLSPNELRARTLGAAIMADYLSPDQMRQVLSWPELDVPMELLVMSKLTKAGEAPDVEHLREIADARTDGEVATKVFALLLIAQAEGDGDAKEVQETLGALPDDRREAMLGLALAQVLIDEMDSLKGFVVAEREWAKSRPALRLQSLAALLAVDTELGLSEWRAAYDGEEDLSRRIRLALVLLNSVKRLDPSAFDPLIGDEVELLDLMGRAGRSVAAKEGQAEAIANLMALGHEQSLAWVFDTLDGMPVEERVAVLRGIMDKAMEGRSPKDPVPPSLFEVGRSLEEAEPGALAPYLAQAAEGSESAMCEALLAAAMATKPHAIWEEQREPTWPNRRSRVLASIADARTGQALDEEKLNLLVSAGTGGEGIPPAFRVQAAWLALCQLQKEREALAEVLAPSDE